jgi:hypothetical protein
MQHINPPPQLSEATFRIYEPYIAAAVRAWPNETQWRREDMMNEKSQRLLSPTTFVARMRDAIVSYKRFAWDSYINRDKFSHVFGQFAVAYDTSDGSVWFRNRGRKGRPLVFANDARALAAGSVLTSGVWSAWDVDQVRAAVLLIHHARLVGPVVLDGEVPADLRTSLESTFNVAIFWDAANNKTIIN